MRYYVVSDVHGYYTELKNALQECGFFEDKKPNKLIVCGDMMDRGKEAAKMESFMELLLQEDRLIFIRGNHEDLFLEMLNNYDEHMLELITKTSHHYTNGTFGTAVALSGGTDPFQYPEKFIESVKRSAYYRKLIPASVNYFETDNYIFVHGWIPCSTDKNMPPWYRRGRQYLYDQNWRDTSNQDDWRRARWFNGMELAELHHILEPNKTIVCGHWHTSYAHSRIEGIGSEFGDDALFAPYRGNGIIAIDGCTAHSGRVNCLLIED